MSSGFILGGLPLKLTMPLTVPEVAGSTVIVAALGAAVGCSEAGWELLQPETRISEISAEKNKTLPRINADERGLEKCEKLTIQAIDFYGPPNIQSVALSA